MRGGDKMPVWAFGLAEQLCIALPEVIIRTPSMPYRFTTDLLLVNRFGVMRRHGHTYSVWVENSLEP